MRLIHRVIIILSAAALAMLVGNALILHLLVGKEFRNLENELAVRNANRAVDAVSGNLAHLRSSAMDWAAWDSSYAFMQGENVTDFVDQNLMFQSFQGIQVNLMYFLRYDGTVVWGGIHDLETGDRVELPEFPSDRLPPERFALFQQDEGEPDRSGILMTGKGPMLVVGVPIHRADGTGSAAGILVLGRFLDSGLIDRLGRQVHARFNLDPLGRRQSPVKVQEPTGEIATDDYDAAARERPSITVEGGQLRVQSVLRDIAGNPALMLETSYARSISAAGDSMVNYVLALMGAVLGITGLAILLMLNRTVLKPVARLMDRVLEARGVTGRPQIEADARDGAPDEIAILGAEFERTLAQLEETRNRLVEQSFYTGAAELVGGMTHNVRNALTPISIKLWHIGRALDMAHLDKMEEAVCRVAEATADRRDCELAVTYLKACMEHLRTSHSTIETDLGVIGDQATHIEQIFYDHERFSRAKRQVETIDVVGVIEEASKLLQHGEAIKIEIAPNLRKLPQVRGHHVVLTQVFGNLVVNAEEAILAGGRTAGKIMIEGKVVSNDGSDMVELHFTDDGQGIPEDKLDRIFERGYSTRRAHSGGIGLHWCANSLAGMGGIWAISDGVGKGATIVVRLPVRKRVFKFDDLRKRMTATEPFRVLVADDEPMLLDSYRYVIEDLSPRRDRMTELEEQLFGPADTPPAPEVELCCVRQGEAAVAHVRDALAAGRRFGAAFLDMRMPPGISGLEAAKRIRALDGLINIVIVSGFAGVDARKITQDVPPADRLFFLAKPFQARELQQYVLSFSARLENDRRKDDAGNTAAYRRSVHAG